MDTEDFLALAIPLMADPNTRHFVKRKERDWEQDIIDLGVDGMDKVWSMMMTLHKGEEQKPPELDRDGSGVGLCVREGDAQWHLGLHQDQNQK